MQDRKFQVIMVDNTISALENDRVVCMQSATGSGKTVMFSIIIQKFVRSTGKSVLILVNRKELMYQAGRAIKDITGIEPYYINADTKRYAISRVYIGMVESVVSRLECFSNVGMVVIDECHVANFNKIHPLFMEELILGVSATPLSTSKKMPLKRFYSNVVTGPQISELIALGYLSQNITRCPKDIVDTSNFMVDSISDDYNIAQMAAAYQNNKYVVNVAKEYKKYCKREKTIVFNVNLEHSREVAHCLQEFGINARHLGSDNEHERDEIMKWFKETKDAVMCNVMIATVGFDEPSVRNIILNFSTLSLVKYIQCCGRGSRIMDETFIEEYQSEYNYQLETKDYFNIIDLGGNSSTFKFGDWSQDRDWKYIFYHPPKPGEGIAPVKTCPECNGLLHAAVRVCTLRNLKGELCLHEFTTGKSYHEQDLEEMILITKGIDVESIISRNRKKYEYYPMLALGEEPVKRMINAFGRNPSEEMINKFFRSYYTLCCEWYSRFIGIKEDKIQDISDSEFHIQLAKNNFGNICRKLTGTKIMPTKFYDWNRETEQEHPNILSVEEYREKYLGNEKIA